MNWLHKFIDLENLGFAFRLKPDGGLGVSPADRLDGPQTAFIAGHRDSILAVLAASLDDAAVDKRVLMICMPRLKHGENRCEIRNPSDPSTRKCPL